ncbi:GntR family transcriptional regulator [Curtobacterium sp. C1]|uniref:GntR family transcriptional regulator n=1 Tax=Curtobacterium citreum TaxID=2036 RepID=A0ABT2HHZ5_9MICO|nr:MULTISPECIES: GntR family transcriptional regulator [Curtobacterium]MCS6522891.1 GntR family transcriptional regulator [Curtobacterium citreum]RDI00325.1 DNA-binding GntR family transcriptional regulator [Curtobacterium sp. AG1037]TQJ28799.1 DNA-binding GntR family transcriptional regulator [Curtobacterium citreum]UFU13231.1 GntR family transcriptional regulator [Curtobacterium sp. C1]GGL67999.1 GntR family transcriptional regulator [Curtobacterium citreum]
MPVPRTAPTEHQLLRDTVRLKIHAAIMDGTLEPGERLNDDELIAWLGVSRTPIREALSQLTRAGLIEMAPNRYTRVTTPKPDEVVEAMQTLGVLFGGVVRLAVPRLTAAARRRIVAQLDRTIAELESHDVASVNRDALDVFGLYVDACGNPDLQRVCRDTMDGLAFRLRLPNLDELIDWDRMTEDFRRLRAATESGDNIAAELATEAIHLLPGEKS